MSTTGTEVSGGQSVLGKSERSQVIASEKLGICRSRAPVIYLEDERSTLWSTSFYESSASVLPIFDREGPDTMYRSPNRDEGCVALIK